MGLICIVKVFNDTDRVLLILLYDIWVKWITFQIPNGEVAAAAATAGTAVVVQGVDKYCGRYLNTDALLLDATVCCKLNTLLFNP